MENGFSNRNTHNRAALVGDIGGTNCRLGIMSSTGEIVKRAESISSQSLTLEGLLERMEQLYVDFRMHFESTYSFVGVSLAVAGLVNQDVGVVEASPHLKHWAGVSFLGMLGDKFPGVHCIENDATAATFAEFRLGAGIGAKNMVYVSIGTGVGGGLIVDGSLYRGSGGFAGEIGHMYGGSQILCSCGKYGCLEAMNSGSGIKNRISRGEFEGAGIPGTWELSQYIGGDVKSGDNSRSELIRDVGKNIGIGLGSVVNILNPDTLIIGGGVMSALGNKLLNPIMTSLRSAAFYEVTRDLRVSTGSLGDDGGMLGAGLLLFERVSESSDFASR